MSYNRSQKNLDNLVRARKIALTKRTKCPHCKKTFFRAGIKNHIKRCSQRKSCPVCGKLIEGRGHTCSKSCANKLFRSKQNHPNWKEESYRSTCFLHHKKECILCGEKNIVEVHHLDGNKKNNHPTNLIPLCPTHHKYWHSRFKSLIQDRVIEYAETFKRGFNP